MSYVIVDLRCVYTVQSASNVENNLVEETRLNRVNTGLKAITSNSTVAFDVEQNRTCPIFFKIAFDQPLFELNGPIRITQFQANNGVL